MQHKMKYNNVNNVRTFMMRWMVAFYLNLSILWRNHWLGNILLFSIQKVFDNRSILGIYYLFNVIM